jgi:hypothetical protein
MAIDRASLETLRDLIADASPIVADDGNPIFRVRVV